MPAPKKSGGASGRPRRLSGSLAAVGLGPEDETVYRFLLARPGMTLAEVARGCSVTAGEARKRLQRLEALALVSRLTAGDQRFVPAAPAVAIQALILNRQQELERARVMATQLETMFQASRPDPADPLHIVEVVLGRTAVDQRFEQLMQAARRELLVFDRPPYVEDPLVPNPVETTSLSRGIVNRVVYDAEALTLPGRMAQIRAAVSTGELARTTSVLPMKLFIADRSAAYIPLRLDEPGMEGALLVQPSPVLDALVTLFETVWERAAPLEAGAQAGASVSSVADADVVALLAAGLKDWAIAHQLGVGHRTVLRRVARLMTDLNAKTRFQAGWVAAQRSLAARDDA